MKLEDAFDEFSPEMIRYFAREFGSHSLSEDAVSQAFSKLVFSLPQYRQMPDEALKAWLYATARNALIDMLRKQKRLSFGDDLSHLPESAPLDAATRLDLEAALETLSDMQRQLIHLRYYEGYNSSQIAALTSMNASTIRYHLSAAITKLKHILKEEAQ